MLSVSIRLAKLQLYRLPDLLLLLLPRWGGRAVTRLLVLAGLVIGVHDAVIDAGLQPWAPRAFRHLFSRDSRRFWQVLLFVRVANTMMVVFVNTLTGDEPERVFEGNAPRRPGVHRPGAAGRTDGGECTASLRYPGTRLSTARPAIAAGAPSCGWCW